MNAVLAPGRRQLDPRPDSWWSSVLALNHSGLLQLAGKEPELAGLSDRDLRRLTCRFRHRLANGAAADGLIPEALAAVREAAHRVLGRALLVPHLAAAARLAEGSVVEMPDRGGRGLAVMAAAYVMALGGRGVHVVALDDFLAGKVRTRRRRLWACLGRRSVLWPVH